MKKLLTCMIITVSIGLIGCQQKGPVEQAGERIDEVIDNVAEGSAPLKEKGTMEKMGQSIDDSIKENAE